MMNEFISIYSRIIGEETISVENIDDVYDSVEFLIYETNFILGCPEKLKNEVKKIVLSLIQNDEYGVEKKLSIKTALNDPLMKGFSDDHLFQDLLNLFKDKVDAFINVKISDSLFDEKGRFEYPDGFIDGFEADTLHFRYPRVKPLIIDKDINDAVERYRNDIKFIDRKYQKMQIALKVFKERILDFNDFGSIIIYPKNCTLNDRDLNKPTLDEAIEHECQHLCIFLLSLAKTYIWFGLHFSKNTRKSAFTYELKESEFITLFGSFCNILIRVFKGIDGQKNSLDFIKALIDICIYDKTSKDRKYVKVLTSCQQFDKIKKFYRSIYEDSMTSMNKKSYENGKFVSKKIGEFENSDKFNALIRWTIKNFNKNLNESLISS